MKERPRLFTALEGVWRGAGHGEYPTMDPFDYEEEVEFTDIGAPFLHYLQRGWQAPGGELLHSETGIWRPYPDGRLAVTIALPRLAEVSEGQLDGASITLQSTSVRRAEGAAGLASVRRRYELGTDQIDYEIEMATDRVPGAVRHLRGHLVRVAASSEHPERIVPAGSRAKP